jgi:transcriptional regulator of acetoin/glycerol metabolism
MAAAQATTPTALIVERLQTYPTNAEAAASLGVTRNTLWRWMCRLGIAVETTYE